MAITVCGINHKTAPIALRERVIFPTEKLSFYLMDLNSQENINEAVILSTCNRSELYCDTSQIESLLPWFCRQHGLAVSELESSFYFYQDEAAVKHMMSVACGLDSMILGEPQILGQMKNAYSEGCVTGTVGTLFNKLFQQIFAVAKEVRSTTAIGACPVSVASAAVGLAKQLKDLTTIPILVVGAGDTIDLTLRYISSMHPSQLTIINRSEQNADLLAQKYNAIVLPFAALTNALHKGGVVITATASMQPIITKEMLAGLQRPLTIIDLAVPRDVDPNVATLPQVELFCIDDLKELIQQNLKGREHAAIKAHEVIQLKTQEFMDWLRSFELVSTTIRAYRQQIEDICQQELTKAKKQISRGDDPALVLSNFANAFTNKLLHSPSVQLRQAGLAGRFDILQMAKELLTFSKTQTGLA